MPAKPTHGDRNSIRPIVHRKSIESLREGNSTTIPKKNINTLSGSSPSAVAAQIHPHDRFFGSSLTPSPQRLARELRPQLNKWQYQSRSAPKGRNPIDSMISG